MPPTDLLTPTLTEADDASGFDRPWHPWNLVFASFFVGPFGAAVLFAWNEKRLGRPERMKLPVIAFVALGLILAAGAVAVRSNGSEFMDEWGGLIRNGRVAMTVLAAIAYSRTQTRRFNVFNRSSSEDSAPLLAWGLGLFVLGIAIEVALKGVFGMLFSVPLEGS